ncbi:hypothetical protein NQZ68_030099 [Dissostichus eleginoides]|nr:hypothetical protein NQZ68_030099 [Dissostichus eleginoides]
MILNNFVKLCCVNLKPKHLYFNSKERAEKLDSPPAALQAEQSSSESAGEKDEDTTPAETEDAPAAETEESSQQTPSG